jgi:hypothetical protein
MNFSVRQEIEILPADPVVSLRANAHMRINSNGKAGKRFETLKVSWTIEEVIGQAIINPRGIAAGKKSVIVGE